VRELFEEDAKRALVNERLSHAPKAHAAADIMDASPAPVSSASSFEMGNSAGNVPAVPLKPAPMVRLKGIVGVGMQLSAIVTIDGQDTVYRAGQALPALGPDKGLRLVKIAMPCARFTDTRYDTETHISACLTMKDVADLQPGFRTLKVDWSGPDAAIIACVAELEGEHYAVFVKRGQLDTDIFRAVLERAHQADKHRRGVLIYTVAPVVLLTLVRERLGAKDLAAKVAGDVGRSAVSTGFHDMIAWAIRNGASDLHLNITVISAIMSAIGMLVLITVKVGMGLVVVLGPLCILALLFEPTKEFFKAWLNQAVYYSIYAGLFMVVFVFIMGMFGMLQQGLLDLTQADQINIFSMLTALVFFMMCSKFMLEQVSAVAGRISSGQGSGISVPFLGKIG
jgi:hypothetical protein